MFLLLPKDQTIIFYLLYKSWKVAFKGVFIARTCYPDVLPDCCLSVVVDILFYLSLFIYLFILFYLFYFFFFFFFGGGGGGGYILIAKRIPR